MFNKILKDMIDSVLKNESNATDAFERTLIKNGWPIGYPKKRVCKEVNMIIREKLPDDLNTNLLDTLLGQKRIPVKVTKPQKSVFRRIIKIIKEADVHECLHEDMGIAPFVHGGGFTPCYNLPEVICLNCGLNVTLYNPRNLPKFRKEFGINITKGRLAKLVEWANTCKSVDYAERISDNPISAFNNSKCKWEKDFPFKITNKKSFESKSGY